MNIKTYISLGWTPILAVVADGSRRVEKVVGWTGGTGAAPAVDQYLGPTGFTTDISLATDIRGSAGSGLSDLVLNEVPSGALNGSNATFTSAFNFVPESVEVFINGLKQTIINDYNTSGNTIIVLTFSPASTENIIINYKKV